MCGTHIYMPRSSSTRPDPARASASASGTDTLDALDDALVSIRRVLLRPGYRRRILDGLSQRVELATLRLLRVVQRAEEPPSIGSAATTLAIDPSTASRVVDRAVEDGYLEREPCADDRRRTRLQLTDAGVAVLDEVTARRRALLAEVTADWDGDQLAELVRLLAALQAGFDELEGSA